MPNFSISVLNFSDDSSPFIAPPQAVSSFRSDVVRFREGDLVGMVEGELSYSTRGSMMLGETSLAAVSLCPSPAPMQAPTRWVAAAGRH